MGEGVGTPRRIVGFAGGGGSSIAIAQALGAHPDAALNHWPLALSVHQRNFPDADHFCGDIRETDPRTVCPGDPVELLWLSPDCRHFSKAKGAAPISARVRGLAWVAIPWAKLRRPTVIMVENVEEFLTWAPLIVGADGIARPDPARKGETFRRWVRRLEACGYVVEWRILSAADYGAPTIRKRLFIVARGDGAAIVWPAPTHAPRDKAASRRLRPYRSAAEIIDFSRPCPSIFMSREEARALRIKRPLEEATYARIAKGLFRHTIADANPFTVTVTHAGSARTHDIREPLKTVTGANRGEFALIMPTMLGLAHGDYSERPGSRCRDARDPVTAIHASGGNQGLVAAFMEQANTGMVGHDAREPVSTLTARSTQQRLITAQLLHLRGSNVGKGDLRAPLGAITAGGGHEALLAAVLEHDQPMVRPFPDRGDQLRAFLVKYYGAATTQDLADPLGTVTARSRFGLVMVAGRAFRIVDIGMRMLDPETELAAAMGVPKSYSLGFDASGRRVSKTDITKMVGNMVCPDPARALIAANLARAPLAKAAA